MAKLTERSFAPYVNLNSLIHIVNTGDTSQSLDGSSYKTPISSLTPFFSGSADTYVTGGTYDNITGIATFTNNTGGTFNVSGFLTGSTATTYWSASTGTNAIVVKYSDSLATGILALAEGYSTIAIGDYSHAEGGGTIASGITAHAEGLNSTAIGVTSHAEGYSTTAIGDYSHSEGYLTTAIGASSHAEGGGKAFGISSHAEGGGIASGDTSHAEGVQTTSIGLASHAEGSLTTSISGASHAEGYYSTALGIGSHAEGGNSLLGSTNGRGGKAIGNASHAEGILTIASGDTSHAEGFKTTALGQNSHSEGQLTTATSVSHAEGWLSVAGGFCSHSEGYQTSAFGSYSHAEGLNTTAIGDYSHTSNRGTISVDDDQTIIGKFNTTATTVNTLFTIGNGSSNASRSNAFRVNLAGVVYNVGGTYTSGADYAEYFESIDGLKYPYGTVVELNGDKIKICETPDNAIGVISVKPTMVGNSDEGTSDEWVGKYEKDIWGNYIMEEYEYEIQNGVDNEYNPTYITKKGIRKKLNPDYDETLTYTPRSERPEWNIVGLMGQIKVLKNQNIPSKWIKMKDINNEIALYLIK